MFEISPGSSSNALVYYTTCTVWSWLPEEYKLANTKIAFLTSVDDDDGNQAASESTREKVKKTVLAFSTLCTEQINNLSLVPVPVSNCPAKVIRCNWALIILYKFTKQRLLPISYVSESFTASLFSLLPHIHTTVTPLDLVMRSLCRPLASLSRKLGQLNLRRRSN